MVLHFSFTLDFDKFRKVQEKVFDNCILNIMFQQEKEERFSSQMFCQAFITVGPACNCFHAHRVFR